MKSKSIGQAGVAPLVFYAETADVDYEQLLATWGDQLTPDETARLAFLRFESDRRDFLAAHVLQRLAARSSSGSWSLTHAEGFVACAFSGDLSVAVGADAEPLSSAARLRTMTEVFMSAAETERIPEAAEAGDLWLVETWTAKEARLKAYGEGLDTPEGLGVLRALECSPTERVDDWATIHVRDVRTDVRDRAWVRCVGGHVLAVLVEGSWGAAPRLEPLTVR